MTARSGGWHSRFLDLPVPLCINLVQLGDRPPTVQRRPGRSWLSLARGFLALRSRQPDEARVHLAAASGPSPRRNGDPYGSRTRLAGMKTRCPNR